jgi:hypothetical protein
MAPSAGHLPNRELGNVKDVLAACSDETRNLECKSGGPQGPDVALRIPLGIRLYFVGTLCLKWSVDNAAGGG